MCLSYGVSIVRSTDGQYNKRWQAGMPDPCTLFASPSRGKHIVTLCKVPYITLPSGKVVVEVQGKVGAPTFNVGSTDLGVEVAYVQVSHSAALELANSMESKRLQAN